MVSSHFYVLVYTEPKLFPAYIVAMAALKHFHKNISFYIKKCLFFALTFIYAALFIVPKAVSLKNIRSQFAVKSPDSPVNKYASGSAAN